MTMAKSIMLTDPSRLFLVTLLSTILVGTASPAAEFLDGERVTFFATAGETPAEIRIHQSTEDEAEGIVVKVFVFDTDGLPIRVFESGLTPVHQEKNDRQEFRGRGSFDGQPIFWSVELSGDGTDLIWRAPESVELRDGRTVELAGQKKGPLHDLADEKRLEQARAAFARQDAELNRIYTKLKAQLQATVFESLRDGQRRWLKYRDRWTADGDNSALEGPGSIAHTWRQATRTRERITYLQALGSSESGNDSGISGAYSDGNGSHIYLRVPEANGPAFFSLSLDRAPREPAASDPYMAVWGLATAEPNGRRWTGQGADCSAYRTLVDSNQPPEELTLKRGNDGLFTIYWSGEAPPNGAADVPRKYEANYLRVADLSPATEPMRNFLVTLPAAAFEDLADPPGAGQLKKLATTSQTGAADRLPEQRHSNQLDVTGPDYLRLIVPYGHWTLCRFPRPDGTALFVVQTRQSQNESVRFWECDKQALSFTEVAADSVLPELSAGDFYADRSDAEAALARHGHPLDHAAWQISEPGTGGYGSPPWIELRYPANRTGVENDEARPNYYIELFWSGGGFGFERLSGTP